MKKQIDVSNVHCAVAVATLLMLLCRGALATNYTVTKTTDTADGACDGDCSLREAVIAANAAGAGPHNITLSAGSYRLTRTGSNENFASTGDMDIRVSGVTLSGAGAATTTIQWDQFVPVGLRDRLLHVNPNSSSDFVFTLENVTIQSGRESTGTRGGGMLSGPNGAASVVTVTNCVFTDNQAPINTLNAEGGAIAHLGGSLIVSGCTFTNNRAWRHGGAIWVSHGSEGNITIANSTFTLNMSLNAGAGAIFQTTTAQGTPNPSVITGCTFQSNQCTGEWKGGAIFIDVGPMDITKSTFVNNRAAAGNTAGGGAVGCGDMAGDVNIAYCRFFGNISDQPTFGQTLSGTAFNPMTANDNWWGFNNGPQPGDVQAATVSNYLRLTHTANPSPMCTGGQTTLTASFLTDSANNAISPSDLTALISLPISFGNPVLGTLSGAQPTIQPSGTATAIFTSNGTAGAASASAAVDSGTAVASFQANPCFGIVEWRSVRTHGGAGTFPTVLNATATGNGIAGPTAEPREGGIQRIEVDFTQTVNIADANLITVMGRTTTGGVLGGPSSYTPASVSMASASTMAITFNAAPTAGFLLDETCYTITIPPGTLTQDVVGDNDVMVRALLADTTGSGDVMLSDAIAIKSRFGNPLSSDARFDLDCSGTIDNADAQFTKGRVASPAKKALCP